jgi:hypothetical protein
MALWLDVPAASIVHDVTPTGGPAHPPCADGQANEVITRMNKHTTRATAIVGTTMALVIAGTAAVAAGGPRERDDIRGFGGQSMAGKAGMGGMRGGPGMGGFGIGGDLGMGGGLRGLDADVERTEHTVQTIDGTTTVRVEQGTLESAADTSLSFSLAGGEGVTVVVDEDTDVVAFEEQEVMGNRGWARTRLVPSEVEVDELEAGAEIIVWSSAEDEADFVASRVVVKPAEAVEVESEDLETEDVGTEETEEDVATDA